VSDRNNQSNIRFQASQALSNFNTPRVVQALESILDREGDEISIHVAHGLADMGRDKAIDTLVAKISDFDNSNETTRRTAVDSLAKIHSVKTIGVLTDLLEHSDSEVVSRAVRALEERGTVETLRKLIESPTIDILSPQYFHLARKLAIRFANAGLPFTPIYPDIIEHKRS